MLDGQHRLAGIERAIRGCMTDSEDEVSVIFLGHKNTTDGLEATRRLFTTLNKTAKPVSKNAVIANTGAASDQATTQERDTNGH